MTTVEITPGTYYNPRCIVEVDYCAHAVKMNGTLKAVPGSELYTELKRYGKPIPAHLSERYGVDYTNEPLPDEDNEL